MRRYIFGSRLYSDIKTDTVEKFDVVVVGGGMAGLYAALETDKALSVALIIKGNLESGSSYLAQGGICCVMAEDDSFEEHIADTLAAGAGHCDPNAVKIMVEEGPENIKRLIEYGVPFDRDADGNLKITREGGHGKRRILHCGGDATGREITKALGKQAQMRDNIKIFWGHNLVDIITGENAVQGVVVNDGKRDFAIETSNVVVATGGAGQLYKYSTTPEGNTGEGIAACLRAGCKVRDMEFVQFHPTAFAVHGENERVFLISEAVRGEGAILRNKFGEAFMSRSGQHPLGDLAPRDIVTRAIIKEMKATCDTCAYLDTSAMTEEFFEKRFPTITAKCRQCGINPPHDKIPVHPTQHYLMGGVYTDTDAKTNISGIYVCGEAACTGVHGANRLASNSTLECIVFAKRAANHINANINKKATGLYLGEKPSYAGCPEKQEIARDMAYIKQIMTDSFGAERKQNEMKKAKELLFELKAKYEHCDFSDNSEYALFSAITVACEICCAALERKESIGSHYIAEE